MKVFLVLVLLTLSTSVYTASLNPSGEAQIHALRKEDEAALVPGAADSLKALGKLLQGEVSIADAEDREKVLNALKTIDTSVLDPNATEEYFLLLLFKAIVAAAITAGVSTGVGLEVDKAIKKIEKKKQG